MEKKDKMTNKDARKEKREVRKSKRKSRKKKELDISIDTKKVDIDIERDADGNVEIELDTEKVDAKYTKTKDKVSLEVTIEDDKKYLFESNGTDPRLPKGTMFKVLGRVARRLLKKGLGKVKK